MFSQSQHGGPSFFGGNRLGVVCGRPTQSPTATPTERAPAVEVQAVRPQPLSADTQGTGKRGVPRCHDLNKSAMAKNTPRMMAAPMKSWASAASFASPSSGRIKVEPITPTRMKIGATRPSGILWVRPTLAIRKNVALDMARYTYTEYEIPLISPRSSKATGIRTEAMASPMTNPNKRRPMFGSRHADLHALRQPFKCQAKSLNSSLNGAETSLHRKCHILV